MTVLETPARILVVEDDEVTRQLLGMLLRNHGYDVVTVATGTDALAFIESDAAVPQLLLLDFELPDMTAREVRAAQRSRPAYADIPVVLMTAHIQGANLARELAATSFLPKPFVPASLLALVGQLCHSKAP